MSRFADSDMEFVTLDKGICNKCSRVRPDGLRCTAFPNGIPEEILRGLHAHHNPHPGDKGIRFEAR